MCDPPTWGEWIRSFGVAVAVTVPALLATFGICYGALWRATSGGRR